MWKTLNVGEVKIFLPNDKYCNICRFKKYVNHDTKYICLLFGDSIERDGDNFIRLKKCCEAEEK